MHQIIMHYSLDSSMKNKEGETLVEDMSIDDLIEYLGRTESCKKRTLVDYIENETITKIVNKTTSSVKGYKTAIRRLARCGGNTWTSRIYLYVYSIYFVITGNGSYLEEKSISARKKTYNDMRLEVSDEEMEIDVVN